MEEIDVTNPRIEIDEKIVGKTEIINDEEKQVIVHCHYILETWSKIRIWKTTYLCDNHSKYKSQLITAFNIPFYPVWKYVPGGQSISFTLIFSALPKTCISFDLFEDIPQKNGFCVNSIKRNKSDVYDVWI